MEESTPSHQESPRRQSYPEFLTDVAAADVCEKFGLKAKTRSQEAMFGEKLADEDKGDHHVEDSGS